MGANDIDSSNVETFALWKEMSDFHRGNRWVANIEDPEAVVTIRHVGVTSP